MCRPYSPPCRWVPSPPVRSGGEGARRSTSPRTPRGVDAEPVFGSWLLVWDDLLPEYPAEIAEADAAIVADALVASVGGRRPAAADSPHD
ncbi:hypothetical protein SSAG_03367 [Streptomyces sp. Mg1]|nr:hypothetical protein SSAG_03367 [Streptomyces sp. Mg1]